MAKKQDVKVNDACKHTQAKERTIEENNKQYKQMYCSSCDTILRSEIKTKGGEK